MFDLMGETFAVKVAEYADKIASDFLGGKVKELSEEIAKIAAENEYNVEQIKRLIESTNLSVYRKMFEAKEAAGDKDRIIEFKIAELKDVLKAVTEMEKKDMSDLSASESSSSDSSESIHKEICDIFPDIEDILRKGKKEKSENILEEKEPPKVNATIRIIRLQKISKDVENEINIKKAEYKEIVDELSNKFSSIYSFDIDKFASGVLGEYGKESETGFATAAKVLSDVYDNLKRQPAAVKVASSYMYLPQEELNLFKKAADCLNLINKYNEVNKRIKLLINEFRDE